MMGTQDASKFNMQKGDFFLILKFDFLFNQVRILFFIVLMWLWPFDYSLHVLCLFFLDESNIPKFKTSSSKISSCFRLQICKDLGSHINVTSQFTPSWLLLLPWFDAKFEECIDWEEFLELWDFPFWLPFLVTCSLFSLAQDGIDLDFGFACFFSFKLH